SLTATAPSTSIATALSTTTPVLVGTTVHDSAILANTTANATGTVAYVIYTNSGCINVLQGAGVRAVVNGVVPDSDNVQFNSPGTYYWQAVYSGDQNNASSTSS